MPGLWVRSQNKKGFVLIQGFRIDKLNNTIKGVTGFGVEYTLGVYDTEEKALEVLNDIQKSLEEPELAYVYNMPKK